MDEDDGIAAYGEAEYEQTCEACGSPFEAAEPTSLCPECELA